MKKQFDHRLVFKIKGTRFRSRGKAKKDTWMEGF